MFKRKGKSQVDPKEENSYSYLDKTTGTISIVGEVTMKMASVFRQQIKTLERQKKNSTIVVEINSDGGCVEAGLMIIDTIQQSPKTVVTRVTGTAKSMGAMILMAANHREALPNSNIMVHEAHYDISATHGQIDSEVAFNKSLENVCNVIMDKQSGKESGYWENKYSGKNLYFTAEQALAEGLVTSIAVRKP